MAANDDMDFYERFPDAPLRTFADALYFLSISFPEDLRDYFVNLREEYDAGVIGNPHYHGTMLHANSIYTRDGMLVEIPYSFTPVEEFIYMLGMPDVAVTRGTLRVQGQDLPMDCPPILMQLTYFRFTQDLPQNVSDYYKDLALRGLFNMSDRDNDSAKPIIAGEVMDVFTTISGEKKFRPMLSETGSMGMEKWAKFVFQEDTESWKHQSVSPTGLRLKSADGTIIPINCTQRYKFFTLGSKRDIDPDENVGSHPWVFDLIRLYKQKLQTAAPGQVQLFLEQTKMP